MDDLDYFLRELFETSYEDNNINKNFFEKGQEILEILKKEEIDILNFAQKIQELKKISIQGNFFSKKNKMFEIYNLLQRSFDKVKRETLLEEISNFILEKLEEIYKNKPDFFLKIFGNEMSDFLIDEDFLFKKIGFNALKKVFSKITDADINVFLDQSYLQEFKFMDKFGVLLQNFWEEKYKDIFENLELNSSFKEELKKKLKEEFFSKVGNNKINVIESKKFLCEIKNIFKNSIFSEMIRITNENFKQNIIEKDLNLEQLNLLALFANMIVYSFQFFEGQLVDFQKEFENFVEQYMRAYLQDVFEKKSIANTKNNGKQNKKFEHSFNEGQINNIENFSFTKREYPEPLLHWINDFISYLKISSKQQKEIKNYFLRFYRNNKCIQIEHIQKKFNIPIEIFSDDLIKQAKDVGLFFEKEKIDSQKNGDQNGKIISCNIDELKEAKENGSEEIIDAISDLDNNIVQAKNFLSQVSSFDAEICIKALEIAGYQFANKDTFTKQFNKLYHSQSEKESALKELKKNIGILHKKRGYCCCTIIMPFGNRILILYNAKIIDGIYNHDDYEKRATNLR